MADISKIKTPDGTTYDIKDTTARANSGVTGVKGSAESSYKTGNVNLTASQVGAIPQNTAGNTQMLRRPSCLQGANDVTLDAKINTLRANRLAFLPADQIIIEKTTDGGTTWEDAGATDATKRGLFSETREYINIPLLNGKKSPLCGLRFTITGMKYNVPSGTSETSKYSYWNSSYIKSAERYCQLKEMYFWVSVSGGSINAKVERATGANPNNWSVIFNDNTFNMTGYSGNDYLSFPQGVFGGGTTQTGNYWNYRITLMTDDVIPASPYDGYSQTIYEIRGYGDTWWTKPNEYMANDKLYTHDSLMNAQFPAHVTATQFNGPLNGNASTSSLSVKSRALEGVDTRNTNQPPSWYISTYPQRMVKEFKTASAVGVNSILSSWSYCELITDVYYADASGGLPLQVAINHKGEKAIRFATSASAWGEWSEIKFTDTTALDSMTGTLPVTHGGTGKTTANDAANNLISGLPTWTATPTDDTYFVRQDTGGTSTFGRVKFSTLWEYVKSKISSVLGLTATNYGGKAATAGTADSATNASKVNGHTVNADVPSGAKFTDTTYESKAAASGGTAVSLVTTGEKYTWNNKADNAVVVAGTSTTDGGLMSRADKTKLNGIATGADKTTVTQTITSGIQIGRVNGTPLYAPPKVGSFKDVKMLLMGNSYMRGVGGTVGRGWGYYFTDLTGCDSTIIQQSGGDFVATGNANADYPSKNYIQVIDTFAPTLTEAERASYQYIVVGGGYNDHAQTPSTVAANIETFVTKCRTYFPNAVIWIIPLWCDRAMETAVEYSNFATWSTEAAINGCGSCGLTFSWFYGQSAYGAGDDIHLNDAGYQRCAKFIHAVLLGWDGNYIPVVGTGWTIGTNVTADSTAGFRYYRDGKYVFIRGALAYTNSVATTKLGTISDMKYRARTAIYFPVFLYTSGSSTRYSAIACIQADGVLRLIPQMHALPASGTVYFDHMYLYGV